MGSFGIIVITILACAFFAGMEIAFLTSNKLRIALESKRGNINARIFSYFSKRPSRFISAMLVGNNISLVVFGIYMGEALRPLIERFVHPQAAVLVLETLFSTVIILVTAEFLPKNLFRINPNLTLNVFAVPVFILYWVLFPIVIFAITISNVLLRIFFGLKVSEGKVSFGRIDLHHYVRESTEKVSEKILEHEVRIFQNALDFSNVKARDCMVPRTEVVAMDVNGNVDDLKSKFIETRLSKILIYRETVDNIIGYVHSHELFRNPPDIMSILLPVMIVPESMAANETLTLFIQQRKGIAVVVDEFGGTSGMLTMEDVIEEIFGEIEDEHDKEELVEKQISENEYIFSGRLEIDYLNDKYNFKFQRAPGYTTLAGYIIHYRQSIPVFNEIVRVSPYVFKIMSVSENRIEKVHVRVEE